MKTLKIRMENLKKRFLAIFLRPERKLRAVKPELTKLRFRMQIALHTINPVEEVSHFFNATSEWQDRGSIRDIIAAYERVDHGQHKKLIEKLQTLEQHIQRAGRDPFGMNRTAPGKTVTRDNVWLGGHINGLPTYPVTRWIQMKDDVRGCWGLPGMDNLNAYDVIHVHTKEFLVSHARPMVEIIGDLEARAA